MQASLRLFGIIWNSASTALLVTMSVVTKAVDNAVELVVIIYLVALQNVVVVQLLTVVLFVKQLLTQDVLYQVNLAFVFSNYTVVGNGLIAVPVNNIVSTIKIIVLKVDKLLLQIDPAHKWNSS